MSRPVTVRYLKYPDRPHWRHDGRFLGQDEHGTWLGVEAGGLVQRGSEPPIRMRWPFVQLIPNDAWWSLIANGGGRYPIYVDVATPARWTDEGRVEMIDLDLDVVRMDDGTVEVLDEDEFAEHRISLGYPDWMADRARASTAELVIAVEAGRPPFDGVSDRWLAALDGHSLPS